MRCGRRNTTLMLGATAVAIMPLFTGAQAMAKSTAQTDVEQAFSNAEAVMLLDSTYVNVSGSGSGTFYIVKKEVIQSASAGLARHCVVYDYDPLTAFAQFKYARICKADGSVKEVDVRAAKDYVAPARSIYWGARQIMLELGPIDKGDTIEYEIEKKGFTYALLADNPTGFSTFGGGANTLKVGTGAIGGRTHSYSSVSATPLADADEERFTPPMRGQFYDIVPMWVDEPTRRKVYQVELPDTCKLQYHLYQYNGAKEEVKSTANGRQTLRIALANQVPFRKETSMVDLFDVAPKLMLSTTKDWKAKSLWFNHVNENYGSFRTTPEAKKLVKEILKGKKTEMEKIAALTHWVADNIRYVGLTMGKGEGYTLHSLNMDLTDRGGVCKDIAGTLIGLLRTAGFQAWPAMTMAGSRVEQIPADHFNHCVCVVKLKNGTLMPMDPTWVPFCRELWSSAEQQQNYLPGIPEGSDLKETPLSPPENHYIRLIARDTLQADGTLVGIATVQAEGQSDASVRSVFTRGWQSNWQQSMEGEMLKVSPQAQILDVDYGSDPKDYQRAPIKITFRFRIPNYAVGGSEGMLFKPLTMNNFYTHILSFLNVGGNNSTRQYAFRDRCSRQVVVDETMLLPAGMKMQTDPINEDINHAPATLKASLAQSGQTLKLTANAKFFKRVYDAADWQGFKEVRDSFRELQSNIFISK